MLKIGRGYMYLMLVLNLASTIYILNLTLTTIIFWNNFVTQNTKSCVGKGIWYWNEMVYQNHSQPLELDYCLQILLDVLELELEIPLHYHLVTNIPTSMVMFFQITPALKQDCIELIDPQTIFKKWIHLNSDWLYVCANFQISNPGSRIPFLIVLLSLLD